MTACRFLLRSDGHPGFLAECAHLPGPSLAVGQCPFCSLLVDGFEPSTCRLGVCVGELLPHETDPSG